MIEEHKFGSFVINKKSYLGDIKIVDSKVRYWDDRSKHEVNVKDIKELIETNPQIIIIGTGNSGLLKINPEIHMLVTEKRISLFINQNTEAIRKYNAAFKENKKIAAIFHATC